MVRKKCLGCGQPFDSQAPADGRNIAKRAVLPRGVLGASNPLKTKALINEVTIPIPLTSASS